MHAASRAAILCTAILATSCSRWESEPEHTAQRVDALMGDRTALFVTNGNYSQESKIKQRLEGLGYTVVSLKDYTISASTDLSGYELVVLTGFAPNIPGTGMTKIRSSGLPILAVEYWDFSLSHRLGLTNSSSYGYDGTTQVDVPDTSHPIMSGLGNPLTVYNTSYTIGEYQSYSGDPPYLHPGFDIKALSGDDVYVVDNGYIWVAVNLQQCFKEDPGDYCRAYIRSHDGRWVYYYSHLYIGPETDATMTARRKMQNAANNSTDPTDPPALLGHRRDRRRAARLRARLQ